jgi:hypothetical protein
MQPTLARVAVPPSGWVYERKEDGWRMLAYKDGRARPTDLPPGHRWRRRLP